MAEPEIQFVVSLLKGLGSSNRFTVTVGLEEVGLVYMSGLHGETDKWVWSELPHNVSGFSVAGERGPGLFDTRMEAVWGLLSRRSRVE